MVNLGLFKTMLYLISTKPKLNRYTRDTLNKPVWKELTCAIRS